MDKSQYRKAFIGMSSFVKFNPVLKSCGVDHGSFSRFVNGADNALSIEKCKAIYDSLGVLLRTSLNVYSSTYFCDMFI